MGPGRMIGSHQVLMNTKQQKLQIVFKIFSHHLSK